MQTALQVELLLLFPSLSNANSAQMLLSLPMGYIFVRSIEHLGGLHLDFVEHLDGMGVDGKGHDLVVMRQIRTADTVSASCCRLGEGEGTLSSSCWSVKARAHQCCFQERERPRVYYHSHCWRERGRGQGCVVARMRASWSHCCCLLYVESAEKGPGNTLIATGRYLHYATPVLCITVAPKQRDTVLIF